MTRWEQRVEERLAGVRPALLAFWGVVALTAVGALLLLLLPR